MRELKGVVKRILNVITSMLVLPIIINYRIQKIFLGGRKAFESLTQCLSVFPGVSGEWIRKSALEKVIGLPLDDCCLCFGVVFSDPRVHIEEGVYIGRGCDIGYAHIGKNSLLGSCVHIVSGLQQHKFDRCDIPIRLQKGTFKKITIGEDTWIGNNSVIGADIGKHAIIGAGSVVVRPVPDYAIVVGNPSKIVGFRNQN
jgi:acetyltransferase-like isoleucine patch superfamily enzyme